MKGIGERAVELARSGKITSLDDLRAHLAGEGFTFHELSNLSGAAMKKQLRGLIVAARTGSSRNDEKALPEQQADAMVDTATPQTRSRRRATVISLQETIEARDDRVLETAQEMRRNFGEAAAAEASVLAGRMEKRGDTVGLAYWLEVAKVLRG